MGYPALQAGMAVLPRGLGSFLCMPIVGILMTKVEPRKLLLVGFLAAGTGLFLLGNLSLECGLLGHFLGRKFSRVPLWASCSFH